MNTGGEKEKEEGEASALRHRASLEVLLAVGASYQQSHFTSIPLRASPLESTGIQLEALRRKQCLLAQKASVTMSKP